MLEENDDLALEGWAHAEELDDGTELIVVRLKLLAPRLWLEKSQSVKASPQHTRFSPILSSPSTKVGSPRFF